MKELDDVLLHYLDEVYPGAPEQQQAAFRRLLDYEEPDLLAFVTTRGKPADKEVAYVVDAVRTSYLSARS
jgi:antitoxin CptB